MSQFKLKCLQEPPYDSKKLKKDNLSTFSCVFFCELYASQAPNSVQVPYCPPTLSPPNNTLSSQPFILAAVFLPLISHALEIDQSRYIPKFIVVTKIIFPDMV